MTKTENLENIKSENIQKKKDKKFNNNQPLYKSIKYTNIIICILLMLVESAVQQEMGRSTVNILPVYITFLLSRGWVRHIYNTKPEFKSKHFSYKVGTTILIWIAVFLIKTLIVQTILNVAL